MGTTVAAKSGAEAMGSTVFVTSMSSMLITKSTLKRLEVYTLPYVDYFEFSAECVAVFPNLYFLFLLSRPFVHTNLRILLANFSLALILFILTRLVMLLNGWIQFVYGRSENVVHIVHGVAIFTIMNSAVVISIERIVATVHAHKYEQSRSYFITLPASAFMVIVNSGLSFYVHYMTYMRKKKTRPGLITSAKEYDPVVLVLTIGLALNIVGLLFFLLIGRYNAIRWKTELQRRLTHRYQISENIRTAKQLLIVLLTAFGLGVYYYAAETYTLVSTQSTIAHKAVWQVFDLLFAFLAILMPGLFIKTHPRMWSTAKRHFTRKKKTHGVWAYIQTPRRPVVVQETNVHFNQLNSTWR